jgi:dipeptidyl aminopeptidase/acylaminoacyl peptidase
MRTLLLPILLAWSIGSISPTAAVAGDDLTATVTAMARIGRAYGATFSPDGSRLAVISDLNGSPQLWIVPAGGGWPTLVTTGQDPVGAAEWSPAGDWLAFTVLPGGGLNSQVYVARPDGTGLRRLTDGGKENNWLSRWTWDGRHILISSNRRDPASMDSWLIDVASGAFREVARTPGIGSVTSVSADGTRMLLSRLRSRGDDNLYLVDLEKSTEILLTRHEPPATFDGEISLDGRTVYLSSNKDRDLFAFYRIPIGADGQPGTWELLAERADAELDGFTVNERETFASITWNVAGRTELELVDLRTRTRTPVALPSELSGPGRFSRDGAKLALTVSGSTRPPDVWVMDVASRALARVTRSSHAGVELDTLVKPELVHFEAHDGVRLSGWLYRPKNGRSPGAYVLSFHGGPEGQEVPAFRSDYQALLSQGIGVFAPNVRGSSGFGKAFVNLDNGPLRVNGVKDIRSCVEYLTTKGIADRKRLGITGGSYGGYMTMAGVTEFPELFAAGANLFGVVNFKTFFEQSEPWMAAISTIEYGDPATQADMLASLSPIHKLANITAAMMVLHGANDTNVPVVEAEQIVENLRSRQVPVEYILFPDEGHGWRKVPNRIRSAVAITEFFVKHLGVSAPDRKGSASGRIERPAAVSQ